MIPTQDTMSYSYNGSAQSSYHPSSMGLGSYSNQLENKRLELPNIAGANSIMMNEAMQRKAARLEQIKAILEELNHLKSGQGVTGSAKP
jgi:hypothetical protein